MFDVRSMYLSKIQAIGERYRKITSGAFGGAMGFSDVLRTTLNTSAETLPLAQAGIPDSAGLTDAEASRIYAYYASAVASGAITPNYSAAAAYKQYNQYGQYGQYATVQSPYGNPETQAMTPPEYEPMIQQSAAKYGLDPELVRGIIRAESRFRPEVVSPAGAKGMMQLMHYHTGDIDPFDPAQNIDRGCERFREYLDRVNGDVPLALAVYNCGYSRVTDHYGVSSSNSPAYYNISERVRGYVNRVLGYAGMPTVG